MCDSSTVFWPDAEAIDVKCALVADHDGPHEDDDAILRWDDNGEWVPGNIIWHGPQE